MRIPTVKMNHLAYNSQYYVIAVSTTPILILNKKSREQQEDQKNMIYVVHDSII